MDERSAWVWRMVGWGLFTVSAVFFTVASIRSGGVIELVASLAFLVACLAFVVPAIADYPGDD